MTQNTYSASFVCYYIFIKQEIISYKDYHSISIIDGIMAKPKYIVTILRNFKHLFLAFPIY